MTTNQTDIDLEKAFQEALQHRHLQKARQADELRRQELIVVAEEAINATRVGVLINAANRSFIQAMGGSESVNAIVRKKQTEPIELFRCGVSELIVMSLQIRKLNPEGYADVFAVDLYVGQYDDNKYFFTRPYRQGLYSLGRTPDEMKKFLEKIADPVELVKEFARFA